MERVEKLAAHLRPQAVGDPGTFQPMCTCARCKGFRPHPNAGDALGLRLHASDTSSAAGSGEVLRRVADFTAASLRPFDGTAGKPVYLALCGVVYDVTAGAAFYGPGGGYAMLGGRDASRALAKMSLDASDVERPGVDDLNDKEKAALESWCSKMQEKYPVVGRLQ